MKRAIALLFLFPALAFAMPNEVSPVSSPENQFAYIPWFTGPLLAPTPINMKPGHPAIEPSVIVFGTYGKYNSNWKLKKQKTIWAVNPLIDFQFGITNDIGIETLVSFISNFKDGQSFSYFQDTTLLFGYQVSNDVKPDFRGCVHSNFLALTLASWYPVEREIRISHVPLKF